jgi:hypothetical protein
MNRSWTPIVGLIVGSLLGCNTPPKEDEQGVELHAAAATSFARIACYSSGAPNTVCSGGQHCCFSNYSADHNGYCSASDPCDFRMDCDGPEDCGSGQVCCAKRLTDPSGIALGYKVACTTRSACPSGQWQLCHSSASKTKCPTGHACVPTYNYELPKVVQLCSE